MENELISKDRDGQHCILFKNNHLLEVDEIHEMFSQFGTVCSVRTTGDAKGYRFVRYSTYDEAERAFRGLKDHPKIKFCKPRNKEVTENQSHKKVFPIKKSNGSGSQQKNASNEESSLCKISSNKFKKQITPGNKLPNIKQPQNVQLPPHVKDKRKEESEDMPELITSPTVAPKNKKKSILEAQEIIVGNIHDRYGAAFILHLFDEFEPIAISNIFSTSRNEIRYCHVYFKTVESAVEVENKFDRTNLSGQRLVVLCPGNLIKEAVLCKESVRHL